MNKYIFIVSIIIIAFTQFGFSQKEQTKMITAQQVKTDLAFLDEQLQTLSSYQGLNGFDYKEAFESYINSIQTDSISLNNFGLFLTETIGKIGDRHSYVSSYDLPDDKFLPIAVAPYDGKVVAIKYDRVSKSYDLLHPQFPYLSSINGIAIPDFLAGIQPEEIKAPKESYFNRAVEQLKNIEECYAYLGQTIPPTVQFKFSGNERDTIIEMQWATRKNRKMRWYEKFRKLAHRAKGELNDTTIAKKHFEIDENNIAYIRIPRMASFERAPIFFNQLNDFMQEAKETKSLIIDVRSNTGGVRDLIYELAKYMVHPDSIHVVNIVKQKGSPISEEQLGSLHRRYLYSMNELAKNEKQAVAVFMKSFKPMYELPTDQFSEYYFSIFNGKKLHQKTDHYQQAVYIMIDERSFSAASVFAAFFKGLPNVKLVGVNTDGSSGNSESFRLPESRLKVKTSTMVSFQKDGKILDGFGTAPDIEIKRSLNQTLWKEDYQLSKLKEIILSN